MTGFADDNAPACEAPTTKTQFLRWVQGQKCCRYEIARAEINRGIATA